MVNTSLQTYLNDHLSGSVAALDWLARLRAMDADDDEKRVIAEVQADVTADRDELEASMERAGISKSAPRQAAAWVAAKAGEVKLRLDDSDDGTMRRLETIEMIAVGIDSKLALWSALSAAADVVPMFEGIDFARLKQRASDQRSRMETLRLKAVIAAFSVKQ